MEEMGKGCILMMLGIPLPPPTPMVEAMPGATVVTQRDDYLYVRFSTRWLGFVDDAEFWADPANRVIQLRSASRLGASDLDGRVQVSGLAAGDRVVVYSEKTLSARSRIQIVDRLPGAAR